jgi:hypothetical protein
VNVSSVNNDGELGRIQAITQIHLFVSDAYQLARWLETGLASAPPGVSRSLDLIAHGTRRGALRLGDWELDAVLDARLPAFFAARRALFVSSGLTQLRLLGCGTASGLAGPPTLRALKEALGDDIDVIGTNGPIDSGDFQPAGFVAEKKLVRWRTGGQC